jgi:hypothetical protein
MSEQELDSTATQPEGDTADANETEATPPAEGLPGETQGDGDTGLPGAEEETNTEPSGAPEKYEAFDVSEGKDMDIPYAINEEQFAALTEIGKKRGLSQEALQDIVNLDISRSKADAERDNQIVADYKADGIKASRKEHGEKYSERHAKNSQVYQKLVPEVETRKKLNDMGTSSQPWFYNLLHRVSQMISEDVTVPNDGGNDPSKRTLEDFFR